MHGVTLEGHGREVLDDAIDVGGTVGWFTTMYPVKLEVKETLDLSIKHIKETLNMIPKKGSGYGAVATQENSVLDLFISHVVICEHICGVISITNFSLLFIPDSFISNGLLDENTSH